MSGTEGSKKISNSAFSNYIV